MTIESTTKDKDTWIFACMVEGVTVDGMTANFEKPVQYYVTVTAGTDGTEFELTKNRNGAFEFKAPSEFRLLRLARRNYVIEPGSWERITIRTTVTTKVVREKMQPWINRLNMTK